MTLSKNRQESIDAYVAQSIDTYVTQSIAAINPCMKQRVDNVNNVNNVDHSMTQPVETFDAFIIQSMIDLDTYVTQSITAWWSFTKDTVNEDDDEENDEDEDDDEANERVIEENATLDDDEREAADTLRILMSEDVATMPTLEYFLLHAEINSVLVECPTLVEKIPEYHEAVIEQIAKMRNRVHLIYHPNDRAPIGVSMDHVAYMEGDHVAAAALMLHTMDELETAMGELNPQPSP
jgi:hypothetical protein